MSIILKNVHVTVILGYIIYYKEILKTLKRRFTSPERAIVRRGLKIKHRVLYYYILQHSGRLWMKTYNYLNDRCRCVYIQYFWMIESLPSELIFNKQSLTAEIRISYWKSSKSPYQRWYDKSGCFPGT